MHNLTEIESLTRTFASARSDLADAVTLLNDEIERIKRKHLGDLKRLVARCAERHAALKAGIESSPSLFDKPRTHIFHGIKVGYKKSVGTIEWDDDDQVVALIKKHFADQADVLIHTEERPLKKALRELTVADLKKLGCTVEETGDVVVIKPTDGEVDKIVNALLADATDDAEERRAA